MYQYRIWSNVRVACDIASPIKPFWSFFSVLDWNDAIIYWKSRAGFYTRENGVLKSVLIKDIAAAPSKMQRTKCV